MKKNLSNPLHLTQTGFTIVELVIVMTVIGILSTLGVNAYNGAKLKAYDIAIIADADAMDSALTNMQINTPGGTLSFADMDGDGEDDGYHYSNELENDATINALNKQLDFKPTRDNIIDVKTTGDGKEYCIRVYNEKAKVWNNPFNGYEIASSRDVTGGFNSCEYKEGAEPTVYSGGAIPGAYEEVFWVANNSPTLQYDWAAHASTDGTLPERVEVAVIAGGGNGNGFCGGGGGGVWTAVIPRAGNPGPFKIVVGAGSPSGTNGGTAGSSSFGTYIATGGANAVNGCSTLSLGTAAGTGGTTNGPDGLPSHKYGAGGAGGKGGAYLTLGLVTINPGSALTGGGGVGGSTGLFAGVAGGNGTFGGGGGGGSGITLVLCSAPGAGGNASGGGAGQSGGSCSGGKGGVGGNGGIGSGGGGAGASSGVTAGKGGDGQVRVLTCFESTCNPIATPVP